MGGSRSESQFFFGKALGALVGKEISWLHCSPEVAIRCYRYE